MMSHGMQHFSGTRLCGAKNSYHGDTENTERFLKTLLPLILVRFLIESNQTVRLPAIGLEVSLLNTFINTQNL